MTLPALPSYGDNNWNIPINNALIDLDARVIALTSKFATAPASATATGTAGQIAYDSTHIYVCVATNTWVRATLATW